MSCESIVGVSVVVPARNARECLTQQLEALSEQDYTGRWEVVVADNGSTDGTAELVRAEARGFPVPMRVIDASRRAGINVARNEGAKQADGGLLLFCDADDLVSHGWVRNMASTLKEFDLAGGPVEVDALNTQQARRRRHIVAPVEIQGFVFPIGANFGCHASVWKRLGGFDESFCYGAWDESDFCYRAQLRGFRVGTAQNAVVQYRLRSDLRGFVRQQWGIGRSEALFRRKHPEFHAALSVHGELLQVARSTGGLLRRTLARREDRDVALGGVALQGGRLFQRMVSARVRANGGRPPRSTRRRS